MAKEKYVSTPEERANSIAIWSDSKRPLTNSELKEYLKQTYGESFVMGIQRDKYWAKIVVIGVDGENHEIVVSIPTANK